MKHASCLPPRLLNAPHHLFFFFFWSFDCFCPPLTKTFTRQRNYLGFSLQGGKKKTRLLFGNSLIFSPAPLVTVAGNDAKTCQRRLWSSQFLLAFPSILAPSNRGNPQNEKNKKKTSGIFLCGPVEQKVVFRFRPILKWNENLTDQNGELEQLPFDYEGSLTGSRIEF